MSNELEAKEIDITSLFHNGWRFDIPLYQRNYSWGKTEINELLNDLNEFTIKVNVENIESNEIYYMGNIIMKSGNNNYEKIIIDGQQRITTFLLFLKALKDRIEQKFKNTNWYEYLIEKINSMIFQQINKGGVNPKRIKLSNIKGEEILEIILEKDRERILKEKNNSKKIADSLFYKNYELMYEFLLEKFKTENDYVKWGLNFFEKIYFVQIYINDEDDEHSIFENINSKGRELSIIDLIKNYLYIYAERAYDSVNEKEKIRKLFDEKILKRLNIKDTSNLLRLVIANKTNEKLINVSKTKELYNEFKEKVLLLSNKRKEILKEKMDEFIIFLEKAFLVYEYIKSFEPRRGYSPKNTYEFIINIMYKAFIGKYFSLVLNAAIINMNKMKIKDPWILGKSKDYVDVIYAIEEYWLKNMIIYGSNNNIRKLAFALNGYNENHLTKEEFKERLSLVDKETSKKSNHLNDEYVKNSLLERDIPNLIIKHLLYRINNHINYYEKNFTNIKMIQIEHIMPQNIINKECWKNTLGKKNWKEKHIELVNKLGNLTLTGYNPELSNNCFFEEELKPSKKELYKSSLFIITSKLSDMEVFDENSINKRTEELAEIFISIFNKNSIEKN